MIPNWTNFTRRGPLERRSKNNIISIKPKIVEISTKNLIQVGRYFSRQILRRGEGIDDFILRITHFKSREFRRNQFHRGSELGWTELHSFFWKSHHLHLTLFLHTLEL